MSRVARLSGLGLALALLAAPPAVAQDAAVSGRELVELGFFQDFAELDLEALLVAEDVTMSIGSRRELPLRENAGIVSLIQADRIHQFGARTLEELLRLLPEFDVLVDTLGRKRIVARGLVPDTQSSEGVLLMLNGHRLNEEIHGGAMSVNLALPIEAIKRLEVLRGPGTALYGPGAMAATINIVTWEPDEVPAGFRILGGAGSFGTYDATLEVASAFKDLSVFGLISFSDTDGAQLTIPEDAQTAVDAASPDLEPISLAPGPADDALRWLETFYGVRFREFALDLRLMQQTGGGFIGPLGALGEQNDINNRQVSVDARFDRELDNGIGLLARLGWTRSDTRELLDLFSFAPGLSLEVPGGIFILDQKAPVLLRTSLNSTRYLAGLDADWSVDGHDLVAGLAFDHAATRSLEANSNLDLNRFPEVDDVAELILEFRDALEPVEGYVSDRSRDILGLYVHDTYRLSSPEVTLTAGLRLDHSSDTGSQLSPRVAAIWTLPRELTLKTLYGRSHRLPSFTELYFNSPIHRGNPDLKVPTSDTLDVALSHEGEDLTLRGNVFVSFTRDTIGPDGLPSLFDPPTLVNEEGSRVLGLGLETRREFGAHQAFANLTLLDAEDRESGTPTAGVPTLMGQIGANLLFRDRYSITPRLTFRSSRPRAPGDPRPDLDGWASFDVTFEGRKVLRRLDVRATLRNLFDADYHDPAPLLGVPGDYPKPGFSLMLHVDYRF